MKLVCERCKGGKTVFVAVERPACVAWQAGRLEHVNSIPVPCPVCHGTGKRWQK